MTGNCVIVILVVAMTGAQPPAAGVAYVTVYTPGVLPDGVIAPVDELMIKPAVEENDPPKYPPVPVIVTG